MLPFGLINILVVINIVYLLHIKYLYSATLNVAFPNIIYIYIVSNILMLSWMWYTPDIYYFYLIWETLNILGYILLFYLIGDSGQHKGLLYYYCLRIMSSTLFVIILFGISYPAGFYLINIALMIKFRMFPFSTTLSFIYTDLNHTSFLTVSFLFYLQNSLVLFLINIKFLHRITKELDIFQNNNKIDEEYDFIVEVSDDMEKASDIFFRIPIKVAITLCIITAIYRVYMFDKQDNIRRFFAYSSIVNLPTIMVIILFPEINDNFYEFSRYSLLLSHLLMYLFFYGVNMFIASSSSI